MEHVSDLEKLRFYRDEVKHEFNLLAMRSTILVTCQSFLVVPFAILSTASNFRGVLAVVWLVAALGVFVAFVLFGPINAAHRTIDKWLLKQRVLFKSNESLKDLAIDRDTVSGADVEIQLDRDHIKSVSFTRYGPWAFIFFWCGAVIWSTIRVVIGF